MITFKELIKDIQINDISISIQQNLEELLKRMNIIRLAYGKPMIITSGFRTLEAHRRIYSAMGISNPPMGSKHLTGQSCDVSDPKGELHKWCKDNEELLVEVGLWCEEKDHIPRVHFQTVPPKSGKRFFLP